MIKKQRKLACFISLSLYDDSDGNMYHSSWAMATRQSFFPFFWGGRVCPCMHPDTGTKYKILAYYYDNVEVE